MNNLNVLYEDNHIIVVEKPYNVLSQSDITGDNDMLSMVKEYIKVKYNKPGNVYLGLVHRLDRPVGGIMVFARTSKAASRLMKQFQEHSITKKYLAICNGKVDKEGEFVDYLEKLSNGNSIVSSNGKKARLLYKCLQYNESDDLSLVEIDLKTGRHHQIRVQFSSRGHALYGDQKYNKNSKLGQQIALFSNNITFYHPIVKEKINFELPLPNIKPWNLF